METPSQTSTRSPKRTRPPSWLLNAAFFVGLVAFVAGLVYGLHRLFAAVAPAPPPPIPSSPFSPSTPPPDPTFTVSSVSDASACPTGATAIAVFSGSESVYVAAPPSGSTGGILAVKFPTPEGVRPSDLASFFSRASTTSYFQDATSTAQDVVSLVDFAKSAFSDGTYFFGLAVDGSAPNLLSNPFVFAALRWLQLIPASGVQTDGALAAAAFPSTQFRQSETGQCEALLTYDSLIPPLTPGPAPSPA